MLHHLFYIYSWYYYYLFLLRYWLDKIITTDLWYQGTPINIPTITISMFLPIHPLPINSTTSTLFLTILSSSRRSQTLSLIKTLNQIFSIEYAMFLSSPITKIWMVKSKSSIMSWSLHIKWIMRKIKGRIWGMKMTSLSSRRIGLHRTKVKAHWRKRKIWNLNLLTKTMNINSNHLSSKPISLYLCQ